MINPLRKLKDGWNCFWQEKRCIKCNIKREQQEEWEDIKENLKKMRNEDIKYKQLKDSKEKVEKPGCILSLLRCFFDYIFLFSISKWLSQTKKKQEKIKGGDLSPYRCVDIYVSVWLAIELVTTLVIKYLDWPVISKQFALSCVFIFLFSYRLFEIFQSWVSQFVLRYRWIAINANRSLVLAFVGYLEIAVIGTILRMIYEEASPLYNSVVSLIANPQLDYSSPIQYVQIMFSILFLAVVAQQIIARISNKRG